MQSPEVKQTALKMVVDVYSIIIIKVFYGMFKHNAEKDAEQSQCQNTTLFHTVDDGEGSSEVVQPNLAMLVFVQLDNHAEKHWETTKAFHNHQQSLSAVSNALVRSTKSTYSPLFCSWHFSWSCLRTNTMTIVPLLALNAYWVSGRWSSVMVGTNLFRSTQARIFPVILFTQPLRSGRIWHKVNFFKRSLTGLNSEFSFS